MKKLLLRMKRLKACLSLLPDLLVCYAQIAWACFACATIMPERVFEPFPDRSGTLFCSMHWAF